MAFHGLVGRIKTLLSYGTDTPSDPLEITATAFQKTDVGDAAGLDVMLKNLSTDPAQVNSFELNDSVNDLGNKLDNLASILNEQKESKGSRGVITDGVGKGTSVSVSTRGQLVTGPLGFSEMYPATASVVDTAANIIIPKTSKRFVITDMIISANRSIGANDATVEIYETTGPDIEVVTKSIFQVEMLKSSNIVMTGLNIIVTEGVWVNIKTNDATVFINLGGYYVDAL